MWISARGLGSGDVDGEMDADEYGLGVAVEWTRVRGSLLKSC